MNEAEAALALVLPDVFVDAPPRSGGMGTSEVIPKGRRNATLTSLAGAMRRRGFSAEALIAALCVENLKRCDPPLPESEVAGIAQSVGRYQPLTEELAAEYPHRLANAVEAERVRREARRILDNEASTPQAPIEIESLRQRLLRPRDIVGYRIRGWLPTGGRAVLAAQFKAGKTTLVGNLIRSLVDGDPFLGRDLVTPVTGAVTLLDFEMSGLQLDNWLRDQAIQQDDRVLVVPLRGRGASFNILDDAVRAEWAARLRAAETDVLIVDCFRPICDALALDENHDAGRLLEALDAVLREADIGECILVHHMGHANERARGDSRLRDWPDGEWRLVRQNENPASPRFLTAYGRDVDVPESRLDYDKETRRLTISGGSRSEQALVEALPDVLAALDATPAPLSQRALVEACKLAGSEYSESNLKGAIQLGIRTKAIQTATGPRRAVLHFRRVIQ